MSNNRTIWKYPLGIHHTSEIPVPEGGQILSLQLQDNTPTLWIKVNPDAPKVFRMFLVVPTGGSFEDDENLKYIGTVQVEQFVWHYFEVRGGWSKYQ